MGIRKGVTLICGGGFHGRLLHYQLVFEKMIARTPACTVVHVVLCLESLCMSFTKNFRAMQTFIASIVTRISVHAGKTTMLKALEAGYTNKVH